MAIWEPCNYVSNLAYDRLLVEMCVQQVWLICFRIWHNLNFGNIFFLLCFYQSQHSIVIMRCCEKSKNNFINSLSFRAGPFLQKWWRRLLKVSQFSLLGPPSCMAGPPFAFEDNLKQEICSCFNINRCVPSITSIFFPNNHKSLSFLKIPLPQQHKAGSWTRCAQQQSLPLHYSPGAFQMTKAILLFDQNFIITIDQVPFPFLRKVPPIKSFDQNLTNDQAAVANLEYNPIIHDLALEPRAHSAEQAVDIWLDMWVSTYIDDIFNASTNIRDSRWCLTFGCF